MMSGLIKPHLCEFRRKSQQPTKSAELKYFPKIKESSKIGLVVNKSKTNMMLATARMKSQRKSLFTPDTS